MIENKLNHFKNGEYKVGGYVGRLIDYTINNQLLDENTWELFVEQFKLNTDIANDWRGEFWGKMMRGGCLTYSITGNKKLYSVLTNTVKDMLTAQEKNGRISSRPINDEFKFWDMWCRKYVLLGCQYYIEICKNEKFKQRIISAMKKHADYIIERIGKEEGKIGILETSSFFGALNSCSILEPFVKLYGLTGEKRYYDFAEYIVSTGCCKDFNLIKTCLDKKSNLYEFPQRKAYEMMSCIEGLLELYKYNENKEYFKAVENFIEKIVQTEFTIIGGSGCLHEFFDNSSISQTEKPLYDLGQETCVTVTFMKLCAKMHALTGDSKYVEYVEKSGYNAMAGAVNDGKQSMRRVKSSVEKDDGTVFYPEHEAFPFDSYSPTYNDQRGKGIGGFKLLGNGRSYGCCACIGSAGTAIFGLIGLMKGSGGYYLNLYHSGTLKNDEVSIKVFANIYQNNAVKIKVNGSGKKFALNLRKPSWTEEFEVFVNEKKVPSCAQNGYVKIDQAWDCETILIKFKQPIKMHILNEKIAFTKGPIVLARDCRFDDIEKPLDICAMNGKNIIGTKVENTVFKSNICMNVKTSDGEIRLCDYSSAGKNYDEENCKITVWQNWANSTKYKN